MPHPRLALAAALVFPACIEVTEVDGSALAGYGTYVYTPEDGEPVVLEPGEVLLSEARGRILGFGCTPEQLGFTAASNGDDNLGDEVLVGEAAWRLGPEGRVNGSTVARASIGQKLVYREGQVSGFDYIVDGVDLPSNCSVSAKVAVQESPSSKLRLAELSPSMTSTISVPDFDAFASSSCAPDVLLVGAAANPSVFIGSDQVSLSGELSTSTGRSLLSLCDRLDEPIIFVGGQSSGFPKVVRIGWSSGRWQVVGAETLRVPFGTRLLRIGALGGDAETLVAEVSGMDCPRASCFVNVPDGDELTRPGLSEVASVRFGARHTVLIDSAGNGGEVVLGGESEPLDGEVVDIVPIAGRWLAVVEKTGCREQEPMKNSFCFRVLSGLAGAGTSLEGCPDEEPGCPFEEPVRLLGVGFGAVVYSPGGQIQGWVGPETLDPVAETQ